MMPAMEMEWFMDKNSLLDGLNVGDKVSFTVVETKKRGQIITSIQKIQE
jgi:Cu/Ag efflux protein CusF